MGSGDRIKFTVDIDYWNFFLGVGRTRFPFSYTMHFSFLCFHLTIGLGKAYDDVAKN